ncbi:MAG: universal stress protein [Polyangiaceae bacterium]
MNTQVQGFVRAGSPETSKLAVGGMNLCAVVGLDFTDADGPAFDEAARIVARVPGSELHLLHVFRTAPSGERTRELADHLRLYVNEKAAMTKGLSGVAVGIHIRGGRAVRELIQLATDVRADFIVLGSHRGIHAENWLGGSTVERLVGAAQFPVLVASPWPKEPIEHDPVIEAPCPQCVQARVSSGGKTWWCDRHSQAMLGGHEYSYQSELPMSSHDSAVSLTGVDS